MLIRSVKLENAKSYDDSLIEFTPGVNAIVGHNGAGKSTILEAIGLALFDHIDYTQSDFVRADARTATVTVTFESSLDERSYDVVRRVGSTNSHYVHDPEIGTRICEGKADVLAFLREHLGVDSTADLSSLFRDAVGVAQGTFTSAFLGTPTGRKGIFDPLLQIEDYRKAVTLLREPARLLNERRQALEVSIAQLRGRLEGLPELERAVKQREVELARTESERNQTVTALEAAVDLRRSLESVRIELTELRNERSHKQERRLAAEREKASAQQALADADAARELVDGHIAGYQRYLEAAERQRGLDTKLRERQQFESERASGDRALAVAETKLTQQQQELTAIDAAQGLATSLAESVQRQGELELHLDKARQDAARLDDIKNRVRDQRKRIEQATTAAERLREARKTAGELEAEATALRALQEPLRQSIDELKGEGARFHTEGESVKRQSAALNDADAARCPVCEQPLGEEYRTVLLERNRQKLEMLRAEYKEVQKRIQTMDEEARARHDQLERVERALRDLPRAVELERFEAEIREANTSLQDLLKVQATLEGSSERVAPLENQLDELGDPKSEYRMAQSQLARRDSVMETMKQTMNEMDDLRRKLASVHARLDRYALLDDEMDRCTEELRACEESYRIVLGNRRLSDTVEERAADVQRLQEEDVKLAGEIALLSERVEDVSSRFDTAAHDEAVTQEHLLRGQLGACEAKIELLQQAQTSDRQTIEELGMLQAGLSKAEGEMASVTDQAEMLDTIRKLLGQAGPYVTRVLIRQISDNARQYFSDIMQDYSRHLSWNEDYSITLEVDGRTRQFSQLSGGEQMTAALAVRLALLRELSNIDVAFFDEPTANLDEVRRESLARQILEVKGFRQLFVISHDDTFEQATQNLIRVERVNGTSTIASG